jgi:hypothetical protein
MISKKALVAALCATLLLTGCAIQDWIDRQRREEAQGQQQAYNQAVAGCNQGQQGACLVLQRILNPPIVYSGFSFGGTQFPEGFAR